MCVETLSFSHRLLLLTVCLALGGCSGNVSSLKAYPNKSINTKEDLGQLKEIYRSSVEKYDKESDEGKRRAFRNDAVHARIGMIDINFNVFQQDLYKMGVIKNTATDWAVLSMGGAIATIPGEGAKRALGAATSGLTGANAAFDKHAFYNKAIHVVITKMIERRNKVLNIIYKELEKPTDVYPLSKALIDLEEYYNAGTLPVAIAELAKESGAEASASAKELEETRLKPKGGGQSPNP